MRRTRATIPLLLAAAWFGTEMTAVRAFAETVIPSKVAYYKSVRESDRGKVCQLTVAAARQPDAAIAMASAVFAWDKVEKVLIQAINIGVVAHRPAGNTAAPEFVRLVRAGYAAARFTTAGLAQQMAEDNTIWISLDREKAVAFTEPFLAGDFRLAFTKASPERTRTFHIAMPPPRAMQEDFTVCVAELVPKAALSGSAPAREPQQDALRRVEMAYGATLPQIMRGLGRRLMRSTVLQAPP